MKLVDGYILSLPFGLESVSLARYGRLRLRAATGGCAGGSHPEPAARRWPTGSLELWYLQPYGLCLIYAASGLMKAWAC